ncbi:hypothetical protein ACHAWO_006908 [Cyclotella atomus]|uniref:Uncharacterized protein n=1 Tax=Cyclotella atomus TaxID=382360 RepID=A0ABD3N9Y8_9STRA
MPSSAFDRIKILCLEVEGIPESELIPQLKSILRANPDVQYEQDEQDDWGRTILHYAVDKRSVEFTKLLVEDSNLVKTANNYGQLPIHFACHHGNVEVAKYLYSIYPESINIATMNGNYPIHCVLRSHARSSGHEDLTRFLLLHDQGAVLTASTIDSSFALHVACDNGQPLEIVKLVYNAYPQAIHARNSLDNKTPPDCCQDDHTYVFFQAQLQMEREAREQRQPNEQGQLPIHQNLQRFKIAVGTVNLMINANPESAIARDNMGFTPLHYTCKTGHLDAVKFLVDFNADSYKEVTLGGDLPLHIACLQGNCSVINYILEKCDYGVSSRNKDGKLPIELLLGARSDQDSLEYVEAVNRLLRAHPGVLEGMVANSETLQGEGLSKKRSTSTLKRKHESV